MEANRGVKSEEDAQKEADRNFYDQFGYGKIVEEDDKMEKLPLWGQDVPSIGINAPENEPCVNLDVYDEYAQALDLVIAQILRRYYNHYWRLRVADGPTGYHAYQMQAAEEGEAPKPKENRVDYAFPFPFMLPNDEKYIREPSEDELHAYWKKNAGRISRAYEEYLSRAGVADLIRTFAMYLIETGYKVSELKAKLNFQEIKSMTRATLAQRRREISAESRKIIRGATGAKSYAYFIKGTDRLQIDPVGLLNYYDPNTSSQCRQYQGMCAVMKYPLTPQMQRSYDEYLKTGDMEKAIERSILFGDHEIIVRKALMEQPMGATQGSAASSSAAPGQSIEATDEPSRPKSKPKARKIITPTNAGEAIRAIQSAVGRGADDDLAVAIDQARELGVDPSHRQFRAGLRRLGLPDEGSAGDDPEPEQKRRRGSGRRKSLRYNGMKR